MIAGTKAQAIMAIIAPLKIRHQVTEITCDMAANMGLIAKKCFPDATRVTDRFHVQTFHFAIFCYFLHSILFHIFLIHKISSLMPKYQVIMIFFHNSGQ